VQDVPAADRVPGDHRHDRLGQPADLHVQVGHVEPAYRVLSARVGQVARVTTDPLVTTGAERVRALSGEHDDPYRAVLAGPGERVGDLDQRLRPEGVAHLRPGDRDLRDAVAAVVEADVVIRPDRRPVHRQAGLGDPHGQAIVRPPLTDSVWPVM
jgi:hypothetical protein